MLAICSCNELMAAQIGSNGLPFALVALADPVISIRNFHKTFGDKEVVKDLSFEVNRGETFAFLGANGSGRATTIRCLLNIIKPTSGARVPT